MLNIGCHLSISKGFYKTALEAVSIDANTFQFFTRNPRGGSAKEIDPKDIEKMQIVAKEHNFAPLFAHAPYTMNLCSDKEDIRNFALNVFIDDLKRLSQIGNAYYIFHPGSHVGQGVEKGIQYIVDALNQAINEDNQIKILLEGMSGKGSEVGSDLNELKQIIDGVKHNENLGVCFDTCHLHSAGFDIVNELDEVIQTIENVIGLERVYGIHLNDNKNDLKCFKDRHEVIGGGSIGLEGIKNIINHPKLKNLTFNLETPNEIEGYKKEIETLRNLYI